MRGGGRGCSKTAQTIFSRQKLMFTLKIICFPQTICIIMCVLLALGVWCHGGWASLQRLLYSSNHVVQFILALSDGAEEERTLGKTCIFAAVGTCQLIDGGLKNTRVPDQSTVSICWSYLPETRRLKKHNNNNHFNI